MSRHDDDDSSEEEISEEEEEFEAVDLKTLDLLEVSTGITIETCRIMSDFFGEDNCIITSAKLVSSLFSDGRKYKSSIRCTDVSSADITAEINSRNQTIDVKVKLMVDDPEDEEFHSLVDDVSSIYIMDESHVDCTVVIDYL